MHTSASNSSLVSIVINNFNYADFISDAINSALEQSYKNLEVIVVDDGSDDASDTVVRQYVASITYLQKENGGQASAMNYGFLVSRGEYVLFLDSDDFLHPNAIASCLQKLTEATGDIAKVQAPLEIKSSKAELDGKLFPSQALKSNCLREFCLEHGPASYPSPPTSGNLWSRHFLSQVFPIPESRYRKSADAYLFTLSPLFGKFVNVDFPIGKYRLHERNNYWNSAINVGKLRFEICQYKQRCLSLEKFAKSQGEEVDSKRWRVEHRYHLAKIISLWKIKGSNRLPISFQTFNHAVVNSSIAVHKKIAWLIWFFSMALAPQWISRSLVRLYMSLSFRV